MNKGEYEKLLSNLRDRFFLKAEIDETTYNKLKEKLDEEYTFSQQNTSQVSCKSGDIFLNRYKIIKKLGEGGMAAVYLAENLNLGKIVAIKKMLSNIQFNDDYIRRFKQEAKSQARLDHPNICNIIDFDIDSMTIIMQYIDGKPLENMIKNTSENEKQALNIMRGILNGLNFAHQQGVIHRDIKPSNILIDQHGNPKITDFGIALLIGEDRKTRTGVGVGTAHYMSPEQIRGDKIIDHRTDVYSCGILLYEMLTGKPPFDNIESNASSDFQIKNMHISKEPEPLYIHNPLITKKLSDIVLKALKKDPDDRYLGCGDFCKAIDYYLSSKTIYDNKINDNISIKDNNKLEKPFIKDLVYAGGIKRLFAFLIDLTFVIVLVWIPMILLAIIIGAIFYASYASLPATFFIYFIPQEISSYNATLGKRIFKIKIVHAKGQKISFALSLWRFLLMVLTLPLFTINLLLTVFRLNEKSQSIHDILTKTYVIMDDKKIK